MEVGGHDFCQVLTNSRFTKLGLAGSRQLQRSSAPVDSSDVTQSASASQVNHLAPFSPLPSFSIQHLFFFTGNLGEIPLLSNLGYFSTQIFSQVFSVIQGPFVFFFLATIVNIMVSGYSTLLFLTMWQSLDGIETSLH